MYEHASEMEPMVPSDTRGLLTDRAFELVRKSAALSKVLHPVTRAAVIDFLRSMNSYYSNLIEGHATHPIEIEKALKADFTTDPSKRALQYESRAHVEVQKLIQARLAEKPDLEVCGTEFLRWIHLEFYNRMPAEFLRVEHDGKVERVVPGQLRTAEVRVGRHIPPRSTKLDEFLNRFEEAYSLKRQRHLAGVVAASAAHHRLAWIHPFLDGNGRVVRLFTDAYLHQVGVDGHGLWTVTRGFARQREQYLAALEDADHPRRGDLDGRGNLSDQSLRQFCELFFEIAEDQVAFMTDLLDLDTLEKRIIAYIEREAMVGKLQPEAGLLIRDVMLRGQIPRGEAARITGMAERTARDVVSKLLKRGLLTSPSPKGDLRWGLPTEAIAYYFPRLYPEGIELSLMTRS
jgi:Fic family protein